MAGDALLRHVVTFGRVLHEAGVEVGPGRVQDALRGLDAVDLGSQEDVYWTLRQTLVSRRDDLDVFDRAFRAWFLRSPVAAPPRTGSLRRVDRRADAHSSARGDGNGDAASRPTLVLASSTYELLREKDFAEMTPNEFRQAKRLIAEIAQARPRRTSRRRYPDPRGEVLDIRRLVRRSLRTGGDPLERPFRARKSVPRKLVLLCDVSGSMALYTRALLLFLHAAVGSGPGVEAFVFGTRLTRLTPDLARRDPEAALERATAAAVDWGSGTRIGASLRELNESYGRRALTRGAVAVILSDGWEREDNALLGREMARLQRSAYAVVWVNPMKGSPRYEPLAGGMRAALPYVDRFLPGHNLRSLEELAAVLSGIERRRAA
jgi:uncharacterized protein with von Willebrand factor type A (vWA) domain